MRFQSLLWAVACILGTAAAQAQNFDAAVAFGARPAVEHLSLSPDGKRIAFISPAEGQASIVYTVSTIDGEQPKAAIKANGRPKRLKACNWVSNARLLCYIYGSVKIGKQIGGFTRLDAFNADGTQFAELSYERGAYGGDVIDWLPAEDNMVLMRRGRQVDRIDTTTLKSTPVEFDRKTACEYLSDGRGVVRIVAACRFADTGMQLSTIAYYYRPKGGGYWEPMGVYDSESNAGFHPTAVDADRNVAYGFMKSGGRLAAYEMALDGSGALKRLFAHDKVDVDDFAYIGRQRRVVGVRYVTDMPHTVFFDPALEKLQAALSKALPNQPSINIVDASVDETKLLIFANGDSEPGTYYLLDRGTKKMSRLMEVRPQLDGQKLAAMKPVNFPAADGTIIPGYLTLPVGSDGKNLPAIVLPHGGPAARDEWGFDWLPQFFASQGYAVLQPQFRGSTGFGEGWFQDNGFKSWRVAIGDVRDAGRWMIAQGIANPAKLAIVGWSYGGYAALQSAATDPALFKAVVAIAPVTDLVRLTNRTRGWSNEKIVRDFIGTGPHVREGSPAQNADNIKAPVLIFHGENDLNVAIEQSRVMDESLTKAGVPHELVTWPELDHQLEDSKVRAELLRKSDAFLRKSMGM